MAMNFIVIEKRKEFTIVIYFYFIFARIQLLLLVPSVQRDNFYAISIIIYCYDLLLPTKYQCPCTEFSLSLSKKKKKKKNEQYLQLLNFVP